MACLLKSGGDDPKPRMPTLWYHHWFQPATSRAG